MSTNSVYLAIPPVRVDGNTGELISDNLGNLRVTPATPAFDLNGLTWESSVFGDMHVAQRHDLVSINFNYGLPSQLLARVELWDSSSGVGTFTVNETVSGGTSSATGIIETIVTPIRIRVIRGAFTSGETITGVGITATESTATCVITKNATVNGQVTVTGSVCTVTGGTYASGSVSLESKQYAHFNAGHELGSFFTAAFDPTGVSADVSQFIGMSTRGGSDGYFVGYSGTSFGFMVRKAGATSAFIPRTSWNIDKLDGTGPSGVNMSSTIAQNLNIYHMKTGYLGIYGCLLCVTATSGKSFPVHFYTLINSGIVTAVADPHFIFRAEIIKNGGSLTPIIRTSSWNCYTTGPATSNAAPSRSAGHISSVVSVTTGAERFICTMTNKLTYGGVNNNAPAKIDSISIGIDANQTNGAVIRLRRNSPVKGTTQVDVDSLNSSCAVSTTGTSGFTGGEVLYLLQGGYGSGTNHIDATNHDLWVFPGESVTITAETTSTQAIRVGISWDEEL